MKQKKIIARWRYPAVGLSLLSVNLFLHGCAVRKESIPLPPVEKHIKRSPAASTSLLESARQSLQVDEFNRAEIFLERALRLDPHNGELWHTMGRVKFKKNHPAQAVQFCLKSNSLAGKNPQLIRKNWRLIERAYLQMGETEKALRVRRQHLENP